MSDYAHPDGLSAEGNGRRHESPSPRVADVVAEQLARWGVRLVFGLPGADNLPFLDAVHRHPRLRFYGVRDEGSAALMASAAAKLTGEVTVCTAPSGPGVAGLINGLGDAYADGVPVLAVTGQVDLRDMGTGAGSYVDQQGLLQPVTRRSTLLTHPDAAGKVLSAALRDALAHGTAVHVSVPRDVWRQPSAARIVDPEPYLFTPRRSPHHVLEQAARILNEAERPAFVVGLGAARAIPEVLTLAEQLSAPIVHTLPVAGKIPWQHPLAVGSMGPGGSEAASRLLEEADWIFRIGANWWPEEGTPRFGFRVMALDVRPERLGQGVGAHFGLVGDAAELLPSLTAMVSPRSREAWGARVAHVRAEWMNRLVEEAAEHGGGPSPRRQAPGSLHPAAVIGALSTGLPHDAILCLDVGDHVVWFNRHFQGSGQDIVLSGSWRTVGFALPAALAAKIVHPHRPVVAVTGDGGLTMSMAALGTAAQHRLAVTVVLLRNEVYASEAHQAQLEGLYPVGTGLVNPDFNGIVTAWGGTPYPVGHPEHVRPQLQAALQADTVALVDIATMPVVPPPSRTRAMSALSVAAVGAPEG